MLTGSATALSDWLAATAVSPRRCWTRTTASSSSILTSSLVSSLVSSYLRDGNARLTMTRGNQRDLARAKNQKNAAKAKGGNADSGYEAAKKKLSNAEIMRQKQAKADADKTAAENKALQEKRDAKAARSNQGGS
ncbi:hypothetical protein V8C35DRAFT_314113 [Trichoderma chlorosporum]